MTWFSWTKCIPLLLWATRCASLPSSIVSRDFNLTAGDSSPDEALLKATYNASIDPQFNMTVGSTFNTSTLETCPPLQTFEDLVLEADKHARVIEPAATLYSIDVDFTQRPARAFYEPPHLQKVTMLYRRISGITKWEISYYGTPPEWRRSSYSFDPSHQEPASFDVKWVNILPLSLVFDKLPMGPQLRGGDWKGCYLKQDLHALPQDIHYTCVGRLGTGRDWDEVCTVTLRTGNKVCSPLRNDMGATPSQNNEILASTK